MTNSSSASLVTSFTRYTRKFRANIRSCSDGWLLVRIIAWASVLPLLVRGWPLPRLMRLLTPRRTSKRLCGNADQYAEKVARYTDFVLGRGIGVYRRNCLKRSLILYRFLCRRGIEVRLCLGVSKTRRSPDLNSANALRGHAWLVRQGRVYQEHPSVDTGTYTVTCSFAPADFNENRGPTPEMALFLACGRSQFDPTSPQRIAQLLQKSIHWPDFLALARQHGLLESTHRVLAAQQQSVPAEILATLRRDCHHFTARAMLLSAELARVTRCLRRADIRVIAYKGPALAQTLFGDAAKRHFKDLDLLIDEPDRTRATDALLAKGYGSRLELGWEHSFVHADTGTMVDLHWALVPADFHLSLPFDTLWQRRRTVTVAGESVTTLANDDTLIVQCINASKDDWYSLGQIHDLGQMADRHDLDWRAILARAETWGCRRIVLLGVALAHDLFGVALPVEVRETLDADKPLRRLCANVASRLLQPAAAEGKVLLLYRLRARSRERFRERLPHYRSMLRHTRRMLRHTVMPNDKDRQFLPLPRWLFPLYFVIRPVRLTRKHFLTAQDPPTKTSGAGAGVDTG